MGGYALWLLPAAYGLIRAYPSPQRPKAMLLGGLTLAYAAYPAFSGQFFPYHWLPFLYFLLALSALSLGEFGKITSPSAKSAIRPPAGPSRLPTPGKTDQASPPPAPLPRTSTVAPGSSPRDRALWVGLLLFVVVAAFQLRFSPIVLRQAMGKPFVPLGGRVDRMASVLQKRLRPGDTVQPLDWTGGALQAMLQTRARLATPFVFDFYFYHHISHPYIQSLRQRFLQALAQNPPRFILEVRSVDKPWVSGADTTRDFPELRRFLTEHYRPVKEEESYILYERMEGTP